MPGVGGRVSLAREERGEVGECQSVSRFESGRSRFTGDSIHQRTVVAIAQNSLTKRRKASQKRHNLVEFKRRRSFPRHAVEIQFLRSRTMTAPSPLPRYIYKILPSARLDPFYAFPSPLPASHEFALSPLDSKDGYLHFSTSQQLPQTLSRFFKDAESVTLLKCEFARLSAFKVVKWEQADSGGQSFVCSDVECR